MHDLSIDTSPLITEPSRSALVQTEPGTSDGHWQVVLDVDAPSLAAIEEALDDAGALAITLDSPDGDPILEPDPGEHPVWEAVRVTALFSGGVAPEWVRRACAETLGSEPASWAVEFLPEQPWERAWLDDFHPMRFGRRLWVLPGEQGLPDGADTEGSVLMRLDPGLAFGTGTHETTALCLEWLDGLALEGEDVIDYGCGSGILAVAAALLGARRVIAIDHDPQALEATRENARRNGVAERIEVAGIEARPGPVPCVVANILAGTLRELAPELERVCAPGGRIALSGILKGQERGVMDAFSGAVQWDWPAQRGDWVRLDGQCGGG